MVTIKSQPAMSARNVKQVVVGAAVFALAGSVFLWSWCHSRFSRFPVHRLPEWQVFEGWRVSRTRQDILAATQAVESFYARYHRLPFNSSKREYQFSITLGHELNGVHPNSDRSNVDSVVFWDVPAGEQRDGWGNLYHYYFDHDGDGFVHPGQNTLKRSFVVWSDGPNRRDEGGEGDDLRGW